MKYRNQQLELDLLIDEKLIHSITEIGLKYYPHEFGGLLLGGYSDNKRTLFIQDIMLPEKYSASKYSFERGNDGLKEQLQTLYDQKPSLSYVGEWHTHPDCLPIPSKTDFIAMKSIANHDEVTINNPVMLIVSIHVKVVTLAFYVFYNNSLFRYDLE